MTPSPAIGIRNLVKRYGAVTAVDGLDLEVERGEIFALLGPNGAGKTTTVEIAEGFRRRSAGQIQVLGEDPQTAGRDWRSRIGIVLQSSVDVGTLTVREMVRHVASFYPHSRDPDQVIAAVGLTAEANRRVRALSGGRRRRLDVAVGIVGGPELVFLDEPTTGFDPEARRSFWDLVAGLRQDGITILLTTHYLDEAAYLADRAAIVVGGRIVALGPPGQIGADRRQIAQVAWVEDGQPKSIATKDPARAVVELSARLGGAIGGLEVTRPTLEDVYLQLIAEPEGGLR